LSVERSGNGPPLVLLHGWGADRRSFAGLVAGLRERHRCFALDLPGFGHSEPPPAPWSSAEYADRVARWLDEEGLAAPALLGHSFGGKVALRLAARGRASRLVLCGSAGIPPRRPPTYYAKVYTYKALRWLARLPGFRPLFGDVAERLKRRTGSADYQAARGVMRDSLVRAVNEDLRPLLPEVRCPTLLLWGRGDTATPVADGEAFRAALPGARLEVLEAAGHYVFLDQPAACLAHLRAFLAEPGGAAP
jgi:pimeloyl-ACP methyl ester carboxylesterase